MKIYVFIFLTILSLKMYSKNIYPLDSEYYSYDERMNWILESSINYPSLFHWEIIGYSTNDTLPIYAIKITNKSHLEKEKPNFLIIGQHQSEEPLGTEIGISFCNHILKNYEKNKQLKNIVDNNQIWFIPTVNPEGDKLFRSGKYIRKRKNNSDTNKNGKFEPLLDGVDLNKNYPIHWEKVQDCQSPYFSGFYPVSELEINSMINFYHTYFFSSAILYHSSFTGNFSEKIFFPWYINERKSKDYNTLEKIANYISLLLPKDYSSTFYNVHSGATSLKGFARDYLYKKCCTLPFTIEVGGNINEESIIFPNNQQLKKIKEKHIKMLINWITYFKKNNINLNNPSKKSDKIEFIKKIPLLRFSDDFRNFVYNGKKQNYFYFDNNFKLIEQNSFNENIHSFSPISDFFINKSKYTIIHYKTFLIDKISPNDFSFKNPFYLFPNSSIGVNYIFSKFYRLDKNLTSLNLIIKSKKKSKIDIKITNLKNNNEIFSKIIYYNGDNLLIDINLTKKNIVNEFRVEIENLSKNIISIATRSKGENLFLNQVKYNCWQKNNSNDFGIILIYN